MNSPLSWHLQAVQQGTLTLEQARTALENWPAYQPGESKQKAQALEQLAEMEVAKLRAALKARKTGNLPS